MYKKFEALMEKAGVRPADISRATGLSPSVFSDWKNGRSKPKVDKLQKIAEFFGVDIKELLE